jgi:hypothetical protein
LWREEKRRDTRALRTEGTGYGNNDGRKKDSSSHGRTVCGPDDAGDAQFTAGCAVEGEGVECCRRTIFDVVGWYVCDSLDAMLCFCSLWRIIEGSFGC